MNTKKKVRVTFEVEPTEKEYMRAQAKGRYDFALAQWIRACLRASYVAQDITDQVAQAKPPIEQYVGPREELLLEETPPAFLVPFGPTPALERPEPFTLEEGEVPLEPPVVELLPDSNPGSYLEHRVQPGETLCGIARHYYGISSEFKRIADANAIPPPWNIYAGVKLVIPKSELDGVGVAPKVFATSAPPWTTHVVQQGDTLYSIAAQYYGEGSEYWRIANANNVPPPNYTIYAGYRLNIPAMVM